MFRKTMIAGILSAFALGACKNISAPQESKMFTISNDTIYLHSVENIENMNISIATIQPAVKEIITAGRIQAIPTQFAYVAPPFAGRVIKSYVKLGQDVAYNTPLFEISSPEFTAMQKEYFQAEASRELARKDLVRKEELYREGASSTREYEEAQNEMKQAEREYENARAALETYHVDPDKTVLGDPLIVRAPLAGNIIENNIVTGQYLNADSEPIAVVANLSKVWITAQVKEKDIRYINEGDEMSIHVDALPGKIIKGKVYHIDEAVDEDTRSIKVLSICENPNESLKIGMYATVEFYGQPEDYIVVSEKAIMQGENDSYILAQVSSDCLIRRPVKVGFTKDGNAYIASGLEREEKVLCEGGYYFQ